MLLFKSRKTLIILYFAIAFTVFYILNMYSWHWYVMATPDTCITPVETMRDLQDLVRDCHRVFDAFNLTHILVYGSLFGALRINNILPWDRDVDMALLWEEVNRLDEQEFFQAINEEKMVIHYRPWKGEYVIKRDKASMDVMIFKKTFFGDMARTGIEPWTFFIHFRIFHQFPARFFQKPLPKHRFTDIDISVPREGIEIQKYFYPADWWKESPPKGC